MAFATLTRSDNEALYSLRVGEKSQVTTLAASSTPSDQGAALRHRVITKADIKAKHVPSTNRSEIYWAKDHRSLSRDGPVDSTGLDPTPVPYSAWQAAKPTAHLAPTSRCLIGIEAKEIPLFSLHNACRQGRRPSQVKGKSRSTTRVPTMSGSRALPPDQ